jgi:hydrogenase expression/formation protein HypC
VCLPKEIRMCLGVPGKLMQWIKRDPVFGLAMVEFDGIRRECHMACVPDAEVGDYVIVHAGIAISRINEQEAKRTLQDFSAIAESLGDHDGSTVEEHT